MVIGFLGSVGWPGLGLQMYVINIYVELMNNDF